MLRRDILWTRRIEKVFRLASWFLLGGIAHCAWNGREWEPALMSMFLFSYCVFNVYFMRHLRRDFLQWQRADAQRRRMLALYALSSGP